MKVIPDSSFFICFIDDLEGYLPMTDRVRLLSEIIGNFTVVIVPAVEQESRFQRLPAAVCDQVQTITVSGVPADPSVELLRPLLGRGEHEVITFSQDCLQNGDSPFLFILDDGVARDLVRRIIPALISHMKGTVGFLGLCAIRKVLEKDETINLLTLIGRSKFRVDRSTISTVIAEVQSRRS